MAVMYKEQKFHIHTSHCDFEDKLRAGSALDFFQDLACGNAEEIGVGFEQVKSLGYIWAVLYEQAEVVTRLPNFGEEVVVKTWPKPRGRLEFEREYEICDGMGNVLIQGISNWVLMDIKKRTLVRGENVEFQGEYVSFTNYPQKQKRKLNLKADSYEREYKYKVLLSDLDHNLHMNNAKYLDILYNMQEIQTYKPWKRVEIAFLHEAKWNDEILIREFTQDNAKCYQGFLGETPCFEAILTMEDETWKDF